MSEENNSFQEEAIQDVTLARQDANQLIPSLESAFYGLILQGYYLPKITSSIVTSSYLLNVLFGKYFAPKAEAISIGILLKPVSKEEICHELLQCQLDGDKQWALVHQCVKNANAKPLVLSEKQKYEAGFLPLYLGIVQVTKHLKYDRLLKDLDTSCGKRSSIKRFFLIPKEKQAEYQKEKEIARKNALESKLKRKNYQMLEAQKEIQEIQSRIQNQQGF